MCKNRIVLFWMLVLGVERVYKWLSVTGKYGDRVRASGRCNQLSDSGLTRGLRQSIGGVFFNFSPLILAGPMAGRAAGGAALESQKLVPNCGCTEGPVEKKKAARGGSIRVEIAFGSGLFQGPVR